MTGLLRHTRTPPQNGGHAFAAKHALVHYASGTVYSFIPKNACTTLRLSFAVANNVLAGPEDHPWIHVHNATFQATMRELVLAPQSFVVLRCPFRRLASVYLDKIVDRRPDMWQLRQAVGLSFEPDTLSFRAFVEALAAPAARMLNIHWRPQTQFLVYADYTRWFRVEDMGAVADWLAETAGIEMIDARPLTRHGSDRHSPDDSRSHADMPAAEIAAMKAAGRLPAYQSLYDAALIDRVRSYYGADISLYKTRFGADQTLF